MIRYVKSKFIAFFALLGVLAAPAAFAQSGAAATFSTSIAQLTTDVTTYGGALVVLAAVGVAFMVGMKYIKKIRGAA